MTWEPESKGKAPVHTTAFRLGGEKGLADDVGVPRTRDAEVPFEAAHLGGVGEVGGADVGGGEAGVAVEEPGLRVESRGGEVVGDEDFGGRAGSLSR